MQTDPRGARLHAERPSRLGDREPVDGDQLQELAIPLRQLTDRQVDPPGIAGGIELLLDPRHVRFAQKAPALDPASGPQLPGTAPGLDGQDVATYAVQPREHGAPSRL